MKTIKMIAILLVITVSTVSNAALVQVNITGHVAFYESWNLYGVDDATPVYGHIIYDESTAIDAGNDAGWLNFSDYDNWEFSLTIGDLTITVDDAEYINRYTNIPYESPQSMISFKNGNIDWLWYETIEGIDPTISRSIITVADDDQNYVPGSKYYFKMVHENGPLWWVADGGLALSAPVEISAVPLPGSLILFLSGLAIFGVRLKRYQ